jgi:hypothetical protein
MRTISLWLIFATVFVLSSCKDKVPVRSEIKATSVESRNTDTDDLVNDQDLSNKDPEKEINELIKTLDRNIAAQNKEISLNIPKNVILPKQYIVLMQEESANGFLLSLQTDVKEGAKVAESMINLLKSKSFDQYSEQELGSFMTIFTARNKENSLTYIFNFAENETGNLLLSYTFLRK